MKEMSFKSGVKGRGTEAVIGDEGEGGDGYSEAHEYGRT